LIATTGRDNTVRLWRTDGRAVPLSLIGHAGAVTSATFSRDGKQLVTTSVDETARLWATATGQELATLQHRDAVYAAAFASKGEQLVTATRTRIYPWNAPRGAAAVDSRKTLDVGVYIVGLAYPRPDSLIVIKSTGKVEAWSLAKRHVTPFFGSGVNDSIRAFDISPSLSRVGTASPDRGFLRVWRVDNPQKLQFFTQRVAPVAALAVGDAVVADVLLNGTVEVWKGDDHDRPAVIGRDSGNVRSLDISADGRLVVVGSDNGVALWSVASAKRLFGLDRGPAVTVVRFDPAGRHFLTVEAAGQVRVWPVQPAAPAPSWDALLRRTRDATTACLGVQDRQRVLGEDAFEASKAFAACERSFGRTTGSPIASSAD
jgi:WD40 repeat protein